MLGYGFLNMNIRKSPKRIILPAFRSRNYQLFFIGQSISLIGTWMTQLATIWLVYHLTNSPLMLGIVGFTSQIPILLISPFSGVFVDRFSSYRILISTQILAMIHALSLAVLTLTGVIQIWHIIALSLFQGCISAVDMPARQAFVPEIIEHRDDLANAIAINSTIVNGARLIGSAIAGLLIAGIGIAYCFLLDGLSYLAVITALLAMKIKSRKILISQNSVWENIREGFVYAFGFAPIRSILLLSALISFTGMQYIIFIPIFTVNVLHGGAEVQGYLMAASGMGALVGAMYLVTRQTILGLGKFLAIAPATLGVGLIGFALSHSLLLSLGTMLLIGLGMILEIAIANTILQTIIEDDKRGRVMSLYGMAFVGVIPLGNLSGGILANHIGTSNTLIIDGIACILGALIFQSQLPSLRRIIRPIYLEKGILFEGKANS